MSFFKKIAVILICALAVLIPVIAFEWPQTNVDSDSFFSFFGQKRAGIISNSLIFSESETACSTDEGQISIILTEHEDGFNWFESTLGTSVIVSHEDSLLTVYGNLDTDELNENLFSEHNVKTGTEFSTTGNSAWQESDSFLEFQIIDTQSRNYINPLILMPRIEKKEALTLTGIALKNKLGKIYSLETQKNIPAGVYKIYRNRQKLSVPYKTSIIVNGAELERITYDTINQVETDLAVDGRNSYTAKDIYPDDNLMLMGELYLPHGKNKITLILTDFSGNEKSREFPITVY